MPEHKHIVYSNWDIQLCIQGGKGQIDVQDVLNRLIQVEEDQSGFKKVQNIILGNLQIYFFLEYTLAAQTQHAFFYELKLLLKFEIKLDRAHSVVL